MCALTDSMTHTCHNGEQALKQEWRTGSNQWVRFLKPPLHPQQSKFDRTTHLSVTWNHNDVRRHLLNFNGGSCNKQLADQWFEDFPLKKRKCYILKWSVSHSAEEIVSIQTASPSPLGCIRQFPSVLPVSPSQLIGPERESTLQRTLW